MIRIELGPDKTNFPEVWHQWLALVPIVLNHTFYWLERPPYERRWYKGYTESYWEYRRKA